LRAMLTFTGDLERAQEQLGAILSGSAETILRKGLRPEASGARIVSFEIIEDVLKLHIVSDRYLRSHSALLRLRGPLVDVVGRECSFGLRSMRIDETIIVPVDKKPLRKLKVPFAKEVVYLPDEKSVRIELENVDSSFLEDGSIDRIENLVYDKIEQQYYKGKAERRTVIWESPRKPVMFKQDPTIVLEKLGWIKQGPGLGQWFFGPQMTALFRSFETLAVQEVLKPLGFKEVICPKVTPFHVWEKTGHMAGSEPEIYYVSLPKSRDIEDWEKVIDLYKVTKKAPVKEIRRMLKDPMGGNCYAQCPPMYWALEKKVIASESLPILMFDRSGVSNRNEAGGRIGFERVNEFHRIEPVFIGTPEQVTQTKDRLLERYSLVFNDFLDLEWRYVDVMPFYLQQAGIVKTELSDRLWTGTVDFEAYMPYRGERSASEWLEFQNLSVLGDKYTKAFSIKAQKGELWSGCSGIGLERWIASFLAQHGTEQQSTWPKKLLDYLCEIPTWIRFL
jgi:seryl-tRNA synthetase